jgi:hypothetical protein
MKKRSEFFAVISGSLLKRVRTRENLLLPYCLQGLRYAPKDTQVRENLPCPPQPFRTTRGFRAATGVTRPAVTIVLMTSSESL